MDIKQCTKCKRRRALSAFSKKKGGKNGLSAHCKNCQKEYWKLFYVGTNRSVHIERSQRSGKHRRQILRKLVQQLKSVPCTDCKQTYPYYVMHFDHLPQYTKLNNLSALLASGVGEESLRKEISKCEVVCANCHCERSFQRGRHKDGSDTCNV